MCGKSGALRQLGLPQAKIRRVGNQQVTNTDWPTRLPSTHPKTREQPSRLRMPRILSLGWESRARGEGLVHSGIRGEWDVGQKDCEAPVDANRKSTPLDMTDISLLEVELPHALLHPIGYGERKRDDHHSTSPRFYTLSDGDKNRLSHKH